jgi:hypothetical protein
MKLKKISNAFVILTIMFFVLGMTPARSADKEKYKDKFEQTISMARDGKVSVRNVSGDIEVKTWDKGEVKIEAVKTSKASTLEKAKENAAKVEIEVREEGKTVLIETKYPKPSIKNLNVTVDYHLLIPDQAEIKTKSVSGDVILQQIGGMVEVDVVSGDIEVTKADKGADCKSVSGDLELQSITGDAFLKTVSGDITMEKLIGSIEAESVSGDIELSDVSGARVVKGNALSGTITYQGDINPEGRYELKSHSGEIEMILPADAAFDLEASTFSGDIESDFEIVVTGKFNKKKVQGTVNGGGAAVKLNTFSGDVDLKKM